MTGCQMEISGTEEDDPDGITCQQDEAPVQLTVAKLKQAAVTSATEISAEFEQSADGLDPFGC